MACEVDTVDFAIRATPVLYRLDKVEDFERAPQRKETGIDGLARSRSVWELQSGIDTMGLSLLSSSPSCCTRILLPDCSI